MTVGSLPAAHIPTVGMQIFAIVDHLCVLCQDRQTGASEPACPP